MMKLMCFLVCLCSLISLTGCSSVSEIETTVVQESRPELIIPDYPSLDMKPVHFKVQVIDDNVYYCLNTENYKNLSEDIVIVQNYIKYLKQVNYTFKEYYEGLNDLEE